MKKGKTNYQWQEKIRKIMRGRYGVIDTLTKHLFVLAVIFLLVGSFVPSRWLSLLIFLCLGLAYYRVFSKAIYKRSAENQKYRAFLTKVKRPFIYEIKKFADRKTHKYFTCSTCRQHIRVPKGKGLVLIKCPSCGHQFEKKT